jgi:molecular chaperone GrpE
MSAKKQKEELEIKQNTNEPKIDNEFENLQEDIKSEIAADSDERPEVDAVSEEENLLEKERTRAQNMEDRYLRVNAEFENYKKRMLRESSDRFKFFNLDLIKELLPSLDNIDRAISHAKSDNTDVESIIVGVDDSASVPDNQVVEECLGGYTLHGRIIRPAMVRVSGKN